jgi:predicted amidohydrolase YtcJ
MDAEGPTVSAVAIRDNRVIAVGDDAAMKALLAPGGEWIDLQGRCVTPGMIDAHVHFQWYALNRQAVHLHEVPTKEEALRRIGERAAKLPADQWLQGRGWKHDLWPDRAFPTAADLDSVAAHLPVILSDKSGHAAWANSRALRLAGIDATTADPPGGQIQHDSQGNPTGILFEEAMGLVRRHVPEPSEAQIVAAMVEAQAHCLSVGLTGLHDFDGRSSFEALQTLRGRGELRLRVVKNIPVDRLESAAGVGLRGGFGDDWLRIGGVKIFADGALGPRTAAMFEPYEGEPENRGIVVTDKEEMMELARRASAAGLSLTVHAIGDRANHDVLDVYEALREIENREGRPVAYPDPASLPPERRHRIEHVQVFHPSDQARLARLGVIASMQPNHAPSDMEMADRYWGGRAQYSYAWRKLLDAGTLLVFGSDAPIEPLEPLGNLYAAVARRRPTGEPGPEGWYPDQRLTMAEAVHGFTMAAAITSGRERTMGSITPGKLADLTIFDRDIFAVAAEELLETRVDGTMVDGRFMYRTW